MVTKDIKRNIISMKIIVQNKERGLHCHLSGSRIPQWSLHNSISILMENGTPKCWKIENTQVAGIAIVYYLKMVGYLFRSLKLKSTFIGILCSFPSGEYLFVPFLS